MNTDIMTELIARVISMDFKSIDDIKSAGFVGFKKISSLISNNCKCVPKEKGVYMVLINKKHDFLKESTGGHFKGKNPTVPVQKLKSNWVENTVVLYIGKAGGIRSKATLNSRLKQYVSFGSGKPVGHWGGRLIWQLSNNNDFIICWKETPNESPEELEKQLIADFESKYYKIPFANLKR